MGNIETAKETTARKAPNESATRTALRTALSFAFCLFAMWFLLASFRFAPTGGFSLFLKSVTALVSVIVSLGITTIAQHAPFVLANRKWTAACALLGAMGFFGLGLGLNQSCEPLLFFGYIFGTLEVLWALCLAALSSAKLSDSQRIKALAGGFALHCLMAYFIPLAASNQNEIVALTAGVLLASACYCTFDKAKPALRLMMSVKSIGRIEQENSQSFLPFSNKLFAMIAFLACIHSIGDMSQIWANPTQKDFAWSWMVSVATIIILFIAGRKALSVDLLFYLALVPVIIGFVIGPIWNTGKTALLLVGLDTLVGGSKVFMLFIYVLLFALSSRNSLATVGLVAFATAAFNLGFVADVALWHLSFIFPDNMVVVMFFLVFIIYTLLFLRGYSFESTLQNVVPLKAPLVFQMYRDFGSYCETIAEQFNLTAREKDIFELMARGRNSKYIQEQLVISQNTVKTHTRNIYAKLGVHSHQELLDLVEQRQEALDALG